MAAGVLEDNIKAADDPMALDVSHTDSIIPFLISDFRMRARRGVFFFFFFSLLRLLTLVPPLFISCRVAGG